MIAVPSTTQERKSLKPGTVRMVAPALSEDELIKLHKRKRVAVLNFHLF